MANVAVTAGDSFIASQSVSMLLSRRACITVFDAATETRDAWAGAAGSAAKKESRRARYWPLEDPCYLEESRN